MHLSAAIRVCCCKCGGISKHTLAKLRNNSSMRFVPIVSIPPFQIMVSQSRYVPTDCGGRCLDSAVPAFQSFGGFELQESLEWIFVQRQHQSPGPVMLFNKLWVLFCHVLDTPFDFAFVAPTSASVDVPCMQQTRTYRTGAHAYQPGSI